MAFEETKQYSKAVVTLGKFKGSLCSSPNDAKIVFMTKQTSKGDFYNNEPGEMILYIDGEEQDLIVNGWTFSYNNQTNIHYPGSYSSVTLKLKCLDPNLKEYTFDLSKYGSCDDAIEIPQLYMNFVAIASLYDSVNEVKNYLHMTRGSIGLNDLFVIRKLGVAIEKQTNNENFPKQYLEIAKAEYRTLCNTLTEKITKEELIDFLFKLSSIK